MLINAEQGKKDIEKVYSKLISEINEQIHFYQNEKDKLYSDIKKYEKLLKNINTDIEEIKNNENNYIGKNKKNNLLLPEYFHKISTLVTKKKNYKEIIDIIKNNKNIKEEKLNKNIEKCKKEIEKYNSDIEKVKQAIWNNGVLELKLNEIVNIEELKKYKIQCNAIINH